MPNQRFVLIYADRSRAHIDTQERDSLLVAGRILKLNAFTYKDITPPRILSSFTNLAELASRFEPLAPVQKTLPDLRLIFELREKRFFESGETADGMTVRMAIA